MESDNYASIIQQQPSIVKDACMLLDKMIETSAVVI